MDEMMTLVNDIGTSTAEVTHTISEIGNMLDGICDIYNNALEFGEKLGYSERILEEAFETSKTNARKKVIIGSICLMVGASIATGGIWLTKRLRAKKEEAHTQSEECTEE